jgi:hypothetical protein
MPDPSCDAREISDARPIATTPRRSRGLLAELVVIVAGVLIALSLEGLRGWAADRALAREAHATIRREIADNLAEVESVLATKEARDKALDDAVRFADELLERGTTDVHEVELGFAMAELSSASWETAERTGALAEMAYADVREYAHIYEAQARFQEQQQRSLDRLATASAIFYAADDPTKAGADDLVTFRDEVLRMRAALNVQQQLVERTRALYESALASREN